MKRLSLVMLALSLTAATTNGQTVTGSGSTDYLSKWVCPGGGCLGTSVVANSLLQDNGNTLMLGNWYSYNIFPPNATFMYQIYENGSAGHTIGLEIELFNKSSTTKAMALNVQNSPNNMGLDVYTANGTDAKGGNFAAHNATTNNTGVSADAIGGVNAYGGYFKATNGTTMNVGVLGWAEGTSVTDNRGVFAYGRDVTETKTTYGLYAEIQGGNSSSFAGYFIAKDATGTVTNTSNAALFNGSAYYIGSSFAVSDVKFKENIQTVENSLDLIMKLSPKTYTFKDKTQFPSFNFPEAKQYGLIAQEVETVIPEMVHESANPAMYNNEGKKIADEVTFKAVNYTELIPILTAGIQEQQKMIEEKDARIDELEARIASLEARMNSNSTGVGNTGDNGTVSNAILLQNTPNPFNGTTEIRYRLPENYTHAEVMIFDMNGKKIQSIALQGTEGKVSVSGNELAAGMYMYSLVLDGMEVATRRMVVNK